VEYESGHFAACHRAEEIIDGSVTLTPGTA
jgi:hypothetical protein